MRKFSLAPLGVRLMILVLVATLPSLGIMFYTVAEQRQAASDQSQEDSMRMLRQVSYEQERIIEETHQHLVFLAQLPEMRKGDISKIEENFAELEKWHRYYESFGLAMLNGDLTVSFPASDVPVNLANSIYFKNAIEKDDFTVGEYSVCYTGKRVLPVGYPVLDENGRVKAVLIANIDLNWLNKLAADTKLPPGKTLTVIDRKGTVLSRYPDPEAWVGKSAIEVPIVQTVLGSSGESTAERIGMDGIPRFYAFRPLHTNSLPDVYIYTGVPTEAVYANANRLFYQDLAAIGMVTLIIIMITRLFGYLFILRQVNTLQQTSQRLAGGDMSARTGLHYDQGELGQLALTFDKMAEALEQRALLIEFSKKELEHEVAERRQAEIELEKISLQMELILSSAGEGIFGLDLHGITTFVNPAAARMLGYEIGELVGRNQHELCHHTKPDGSPFQVEHCPIYAAYQDGLVHRVSDELFWRKNGSSFPVEYISTPIRKPDGIVGAVVVFKDITSQKQVEVTLAKSRDFYLTLFEEFPALIWRSGVDAGCNYINNTWSKFTGRTMKQELGDGWAEGVHPDDLDRCIKTYLDAFNAQLPFVMEYRLRRYDGEYRWIIDYGRPFCNLDGNFAGYIGACYDITERKEAEEALRVSEENYRAIFENTGAATAIFEEDTTISLINTEFEKLSGYSKEEVEGKKSWTEFIFKTDLERMKGYHALRRQAGVVPRNYEFRFFDRFNEIKDIFMTVALIPGSKKSAASLLDITKRKQAEERIRYEAARAEVLSEVSQELANINHNNKDVLGKVARRIAEFFGDACVIYLDDNRGLNPVPFYHAKPEAHNLMSHLFETAPPGTDLNFNGHVLQTGVSLLIPSINEEQARGSIKQEYWPYLDNFGISSLLIAPLHMQDKTIGTISVWRDSNGSSFTSPDQSLLQGIADRVALAVISDRLYNENLHQLKTIRSLYLNAQKLGQSLNLNDIAGDITRTCVEDFGVRMAWLGRAEEDGSVRLITSHPITDYLSQIKVRWDDTPLGQGAFGRAIREANPVIITDTANNPTMIPWRELAIEKGFRCIGAFPLVSRGRTFGALGLYSDQFGFFTPGRIEFFQAYAHQAATALEKARLFEEAERRYERLEALRTIDMAITGSLDLRVTFNVILDQVTTQLGIHAADILLLNPYTRLLEYAAGRGFRTKGIERTTRRMGEGNPGYATSIGEIVFIPNLPEEGNKFDRASVLQGENFVAYYGIPLVAKGVVKGVLEIFHRNALEADQEWLDFLEALAGQTAIAIDNATLFDNLYRTNIELTLAYDATIEGFSDALDRRNRKMEGHNKRATEMTVRLGRTLGMSEQELVHVRHCALLHDIGNMEIPDRILQKPGPLNNEEWEIMRRHPIYAYEMLSPVNYLRPAIDIPYCHHERWDGSGYPRGLKGEQIPLAARIFAVVDVWEALLSKRPYRPAWSREEARRYILERSGKDFDPKVVEVFMQMESD